MTTRRSLFKSAVALGAAAVAATPTFAAGEAPAALPSGKLCVLVYGRSRTQLPPGHLSSAVVVDVPSFEVERIPSTVSNLHGLLQAGPGASQVWGLGHSSAERMEVFDRNMKRLEVRTYPGIVFRGHGISWGDGVLVAAERASDPMAGGLLLQLDAQGRVVAEHPSGGIRPHEIVVCGEYLAVAHYGDRPRAPGAVSPGMTQRLVFDIVSPGVSFLKRDSLEVVAFHRMPGDAATTHLATTSDGKVMAMGINTVQVPSSDMLYPLAGRDGATLLSSEWYERGYELWAPTYKVDPLKGIVETIAERAPRMRRGQSFAHDASAGLVAGTFAGSQTLFLQMAGRADRFVSTLDFGVPNPRGCAVLPGTTLVAVSGNDDNVAIIDAATEKLVKLVGLPLGGHSHMFWIPA